MKIVYEPPAPRYLVVVMGRQGTFEEHDVQYVLSAHDTRESSDKAAQEARYTHPGERIVVMGQEG